MAIVFPVHNTAAFDYHDGYIVKVEEREIRDLGYSYSLTVYQPGSESSPPGVNSRDRRSLQEIADETHDDYIDRNGPKYQGPHHRIQVTYF